MVKVGDKIRIKAMRGEPQYNGCIGEVTFIDDIGQIHGTWGGCAIIPREDTYEVIKVCPICNREYSERPALSRRDNKTEICPNCGMLEALEDMKKATHPHGGKEEKDEL